MKLTRRQLNQIIAESLNLNEAKILNFRKIRKDLEALEEDPDNETLLNKISAHRDELKAKVDAGETKFFKGRYREAKTLLTSLNNTLKNPKEEVEKAIQNVIKVEEPTKPKSPTKPKDDWVKDPTGDESYVFKIDNCVWLATNTKSGKQFTLGKADGSGKKYLKTIAKLNNTYPDLVKDCNPIKVVPKKPTTPKPGTPKVDSPKISINRTDYFYPGAPPVKGANAQFFDFLKQFKLPNENLKASINDPDLYPSVDLRSIAKNQSLDNLMNTIMGMINQRGYEIIAAQIDGIDKGNRAFRVLAINKKDGKIKMITSAIVNNGIDQPFGGPWANSKVTSSSLKNLGIEFN